MRHVVTVLALAGFTVLSVLVLCARQSAADAAELEKVVAGLHDDFVRIVYHLDGPISYEEIGAVDNSVRFVLDGVHMASAITKDTLPEFDQRFAPVSGLSLEQFNDGVLVSIAITGDTSVKHFALAPDSYGGHRVVIDITRTKPDSLPAPQNIGGKTDGTAGADDRATSTPPDGTSKAEGAQATGQPDGQSASPGPAAQTLPDDPFKTARFDGDQWTDGVAETGPIEQKPAQLPLKADDQPAPQPAATPVITGSLPPDVPSYVPFPSEILPADHPCHAVQASLIESHWAYALAMDLAACLADKGDLSKARFYYEEVLARDPDFHRARLLLAEIYTETGKSPEAKDAYLHVLASRPPQDVEDEILRRLEKLRRK